MGHDEFYVALQRLQSILMLEAKQLRFPPVTARRWAEYREKRRAIYDATAKEIDDLVLKRATQIRRERKEAKNAGDAGTT